MTAPRRPLYTALTRNLVHPPQVLYAGHNQLQELPDVLHKLVSLQLLSVQHNRLAALPPTLTRLTGLRALAAGGNRLRQLPQGFLESGGLALGAGIHAASLQPLRS